MFKIFVKLAAAILDKIAPEDKPRADMFLPRKFQVLSVVLTVIGILLGVYAFLRTPLWAVIVSPVCLILGISLFLCWRNQKITVLSDETFEYSTFLGKKTVYRFDEIKGIRKNSDSMTMFVGDGKVHIESAAVMTKALSERINRQLAAMYGQSEE